MSADLDALIAHTEGQVNDLVEFLSINSAQSSPDAKKLFDLDDLVDSSSAFLGPNLWSNSGDVINLNFDAVLNFDEGNSTSSTANVTTEDSSVKLNDGIEESQEDKPNRKARKKRGRKQSTSKPKKRRKIEILIPGADFDPTTCLCEDELQPHPIVRKAEKTVMPSDKKDLSYWTHRVKNNMAAKKSRETRRAKENQIAIRAAFLESENKRLSVEVDKLKQENVHLKSVLAGLEK